MDKVDDFVVTMRWIDVTEGDLLAEARERLYAGIAALDEFKFDLLARRLGLTDREATPLATYLKAMHGENGLAYAVPAHPAIANAVQEGGLRRFIWWLA